MSNDNMAYSVATPRARTVALVAVPVALAVCLPAPAVAQTCDDLDAWNFFQSASAEQVAACLRSGVDPDTPDDRGHTLLHRAALYATDPAVIATLVEFGADLDARNLDQATPLHRAWANPLVARELLRLGADPAARDKYGHVADPTRCDHWNTWMFGRVALAQDVTRCLASGADPRARDEHGSAPLHHAILGMPHDQDDRYVPGARRPEGAPDLAVVVRLIESGADPRASNHSGDTPVHFAARTGDLAVMRLLLASGADPDVRDRQGNSPLHEAAGAGDSAMVELLLDEDVAVNAEGTDGSTPLHGALDWWESSLAAARILLEAGADAGARNGRGRTALHLAVAEWRDRDPAEQRRFVASLLSAGADLDVRDNMGWTPLYVAAYREDPSLAAVLLESGADAALPTARGETPLHAAAQQTGTATIVVLIEGGVDVNAPDGSGDTPLHVAATAGTPATVEVLLAGGADIHAKNASGATPLHAAAHFPRRRYSAMQEVPRVDTAIVRTLIRSGAELDARDAQGRTPLHTAWAEGNVLVADQLVALGADPDALDATGWRAGDPACDWRGWNAVGRSPVEGVRGCLAMGTDPNGRDEYGRTLLHRLVTLWDGGLSPLPTIRALLEAGADANARDAGGRNPLHSATGARGEQIEVSDALLEAGADVNAVDNDNATPLHAAAASGSRAYISWLVDSGAEVNARDAAGRTPLHAAVENPGVAALLLTLGADPGALDSVGTPADPAACDHWNTPSFFMAADARVVGGCVDMGADVNATTEQWPTGYWGGDVTPLHSAAAWARDPGVIPLLVEAGADLDARDDRDFSPLHAAARINENEAVVRALLAAGAEVDAWATGFDVDYGWEATPLLEAAESNGNPEVLAALIDAGADASARGWGGETVLHRAARGGSAEVVSFLLGAGADVRAVQAGGSTPLHEAASRNPDPAVTQLLLDAGADVHVVGSGIQASTGWDPSTPLHLAAGYNPEAAVLTALLAAGADPNAEAERGGWTPLHAAAWANRNLPVIRVLVAAGADVGARTRTGATALHLAARNNPQVVPLLLELGADPSASDNDGTTALTLMKRNKALRGLAVVGPVRHVPPAPPPGPTAQPPSRSPPVEDAPLVSAVSSPRRVIPSTVVEAAMWPITLAAERNTSGTRSIPSRMPSPAMGTPTTLSAGTSDTMLALGTGATVIEARKIASTAAAMSPASSGTPYMAARKTSDAL